MNEHIYQDPAFQAKLVSPEEAVKIVNSGDIVYVGCNTSTANVLCNALGNRKDELENVTIATGIGTLAAETLQILDPRNFRISTVFMGSWERKNSKYVPVDYTSVHLSQAYIWCKETAPADVAFFDVSLPDENGYMSFGPSGCAINTHVKEAAKKIILQINRHTPYVFGENNLIHFSEADLITEGDFELATLPSPPNDDITQKISEYLLEQISDGACIQLGIGGLSNAVGKGLVNKNDLGVHSELMNDSIMELMKLGVANNSRKNFMPGKTVSAFAFGSKELYQYIDRNPDVYFMPFKTVNDPVTIAKNDNVISINTALTIDIMGQVCSDTIAGRQYSATGGQLDFVRGAQMSKGGKSFIAVTSTAQTKNGRVSRIVSRLPAGSAVTTLRSDLQYVVTEYGCVNLKPLTMRERVHAMISLAHPDERPQLTEDAKRFGLI